MTDQNKSFDQPNTRDPAEGHDPKDTSRPKSGGVNTREPAEGGADETSAPGGAQKSPGDPKHPKNPL